MRMGISGPLDACMYIEYHYDRCNQLRCLRSSIQLFSFFMSEKKTDLKPKLHYTLLITATMHMIAPDFSKRNRSRYSWLTP